jgi:hypothetical protein
MAKETERVDYLVLLYPPHGVPRVVEVPHVAPEIAKLMPPVERFDSRAAGEAALEKFLTDNPEYRHWRDGRIQLPQTDEDPEQFDRLRQPGFGIVPGIYE